MTVSYRHPEFLISAADLHARLPDPHLVVLDATTTLVPFGDGGFRLISGEEAFGQGHIPGARYLHLENDFSRPAEGLLFTLPDIARFASAALRFGIGADSFVVVYSTAQPGWAARFWLMLRAFGFTNAAVLNGGFKAWKDAGFPVETGPARKPAAPAAPFAWRDETERYFTGTDTVSRTLDGGAARLVNSLSADMFRGEGPIAYGRPGHIPGSVNVPTADLADADGFYLEAPALARLFRDRGVSDTDEAITYCGAGVAASNVAFARLLLGHGDTKVYDGSLLEWSSDPERPLVTG